MKPKYLIFLAPVIFSVAGCGAEAKFEDTDTKLADNTAAPTVSNEICLTVLSTKIDIKAGESRIGNDRAYSEEAPAYMKAFEDFDIDAHEVTNDQFSAFVTATGHLTTAEQVQPGYDVMGGAIFTEPSLDNPSWWRFVEGANWRAPTGPGSTIKGFGHYPVVQVSHEDATAYAKWAGRALPSEDQWEYAAGAGVDTLYVWGGQMAPGGEHQANTWQGAFPIQNDNTDGYFGSAPAGCYEPNNFGLYDMIGNVWEWTDTQYRETTGEKIFVIKGGSFLCAPSYCRRYRASAKQPQEARFSTNHIGFRTVSKRLD